MPGQVKTQINIPRNYREAPLSLATLDIEARTVDVVWATTRPVLRMGWGGEDPYYYEELSLDPACIVLERFDKGLSVLDSHNRDSVENILGAATDPVFPKGNDGEHVESICKARFSSYSPLAERVFKDINDGIIRHWSFGYDVIRKEKTDRKIDGVPVYRAILWEPFELSVVPVPADPGAGTRDSHTISRACEIITMRENTMTEEEKKRQAEEEEAKKKQAEEEEEAEKNKKAKKGKKEDEDDDSEERARLKRAYDLAQSRERTRQREIRQAVKVFAGVVDDDHVERYIDSDMSADDVRRELITLAAEKQPKINSASSIEITNEARDKKREAMTRSLLHRANPGTASFSLAADDGAREFTNLKLLELARHCLESAGINCRMMTRRQIAETALGFSAQYREMAIGDFPILLGDAVKRRLREAYQLAPQTFAPFCRRVSAPDFRPMRTAAISDGSGFVEVPEGGHYKHGKLNEDVMEYGVKKFGRLISITLEAITNDDLNAFNRLPTMYAAEARQLESDIVYDLIVKNAKMADGKPLFDSAHGNMGPASEINYTGVNAGFIAIGGQTAANKRKLNLRPSFILVGPHKEGQAGQYLTSTTPAKQEDVIPAYMKSLTMISEGRIPDKQWYLVCAPEQIDTIEYAYLEGEEGLFTEDRWNFDTDSYDIKARLVFGAAAIDHRGFYKNPGA